MSGDLFCVWNSFTEKNIKYNSAGLFAKIKVVLGLLIPGAKEEFAPPSLF